MIMAHFQYPHYCTWHSGLVSGVRSQWLHSVELVLCGAAQEDFEEMHCASKAWTEASAPETLAENPTAR